MNLNSFSLFISFFHFFFSSPQFSQQLQFHPQSWRENHVLEEKFRLSSKQKSLLKSALENLLQPFFEEVRKDLDKPVTAVDKVLAAREVDKKIKEENSTKKCPKCGEKFKTKFQKCQGKCKKQVKLLPKSNISLTSPTTLHEIATTKEKPNDLRISATIVKDGKLLQLPSQSLSSVSLNPPPPPVDPTKVCELHFGRILDDFLYLLFL